MPRSLTVLLAAAVSAVLLSTAAQAVTIRTFPLPAGSDPQYLKPGPDGNLWIASRGATPGIVRMTTGGTALDTIASPAPPQDLAVAPSGAVYWTSYARSPSGGFVTRRTASGLQDSTLVPGTDFLDALAVGPGERVSFTASRYEDSAAMICLARFGAGAVILCNSLGVQSSMRSLVYRSDGLLTAPLMDLHMVALFSADVDGQANTLDASGSTGEGSGPARVVLGPDGNLWYTLFDAGAILGAGGQTFPLPAPAKPWDITVGPDGALWFTTIPGTIGRITTSGQITEFPLPAGSGRPYGITTGPDGNIWFTTKGPGAVGRLSFDPVTAGSRGGGGGGGGGGGIADRAAPRVSPGLRLSGFRQGRGSTFTYTLSEPARVAIEVGRRAGTGRRVDGRCVRRTRANRSRPRCTRYSSLGTVRANGRQGANELRFSGRLNGRALSPGTYRASLTATDAAGNASRVSTATFTVRRR